MNNYEALIALPDVVFAETDAAKTEQSILTLYEGITKTVLYPGDPVRVFLTTLSAVINQQKVIINETGRQNLLRYAKGIALDHLGSPVGVYRLKASAAGTEMEFFIQAALLFPVVVPAGTRITADGKVYFQTDTEVSIQPGEVSVTVSATCLSTGANHNGLSVGEINRLVDQLSYVTKVTNTIESSGGSDTEKDEPFRARIALAPESFNTTGPVLAYIFHALSAHPDIADVSITRPVAGTVQVNILLKNGIIPQPDGPEVKAVEALLNPEKKRPLNDTVLVRPGTAISIDYTLTWYISSSQRAFVKDISKQIADAVAEYETWQTSVLGRDVISDDLIQRCREAGAKRVAISGLNYRKLDKTEVCEFVFNPNRILYGGEED
ncbi:baseplate J/gp47 family protein [Budviciaceae bacterium CWB-B4]|uniref:Baseplate J/gp47 family protein n=1 Tax=Limnobaculum xujianqingii TaxID=2738837 RepID=A0A9D7AIA8_9GAMM|nr:baseplate J/gp47 family protein [Limnobaculum xujianqingii]MBK5073218.1 baseplate J/gp47 family protein [Limnobaculum xujianqingii]MBK5176527.1 baseplate J/gp47 family protein [Limnobaculum xujianqingii]